MKESIEIIFPDSKESAEYREDIRGWVSKGGLYFGQDEAGARRSGCTVYRCEGCGATVLKYHNFCSSCINKREIAKYNAMPKKEWDGIAMLYSDALNVWFGDISEAEEDAELNEPLALELKDLRLIIGERINFFSLNASEIYVDILPEDGDIPKEIKDAFDELNKKIESYAKVNCASWTVGKYRLKLEEK